MSHSAIDGAHDGTETAILGGGCFWCLEALFQRVPGVISVRPGYCGGELANPDYEAVCSGTTGHAEVVEVRFDPVSLGFGELLDCFFVAHDPTTRNRQGNDIGTQYRSVIFPQSERQAAAAASAVERWNGPERYGGRIVTQIEPVAPFWPAETYHHDYFEKHPEPGYCAVVIAPKLAAFVEASRKLLTGCQPGRS